MKVILLFFYLKRNTIEINFRSILRLFIDKPKPKIQKINTNTKIKYLFYTYII